VVGAIRDHVSHANVVIAWPIALLGRDKSRSVVEKLSRGSGNFILRCRLDPWG
jgi:hypothetical protein